MNPSILVIYHGGCRDGFCAAWVAHSMMPADAEYFAGYYGQDPPDVRGRVVYIVDFSYPRPIMEAIARDAAHLTVLDHHKTAEEALRGLPGAHVVFDMNRSGAGIAFDYWHPGEERNWLVDYVQDRDLWRHQLPDSEIINAWIGTIPFTFEAWTAAHTDLAQDHWEVHDAFRGARIKGLAVQAKVKQYVAEVRKNARRITFDGHDVPIVNAPQVDVSELGHALAEGETFAMAWWQRADGVFQYSLRSIGDFDVSELAKRRGGGGHKNAAGFQSETLL